MDQLPLPILSRICSFTSTKDLINLCNTAKGWYLPSITQLYKKIIISSERSLITDVKQSLSNYTALPYLGTLIHSSKVLHVLSVLNENINLAHCVKELVFLDDWENYTGSKIMSVYLKKLLFEKLHLDTFIFPVLVQTSLADLSKLSISGTFNSISKLSITIGSHDINEVITLPNLATLRIYYYEEPQTNFLFSKLAMALAYGQSLIKLKLLELKNIPTPWNDDELMNSLNGLSLGGGSRPIPPWFDFFKALKQLEQGLILQEFGINGGWFEEEDLELIASVVHFQPLRELKLELNCHHNHSGFSILEVVSPQTLCIDFATKCNLCENLVLSSLCKYQLSNLLITGANLPLQQINETLIKYQQSLIGLKIFDSATYVNDYELLSKCLNHRMSILNFDYGVSYDKLIKTFFMKDMFNDNSMVVNDYTLHFVSDNQHGLNEFLKYYLNIAFSPFIDSKLNVVKELTRLEYLEVFNMKVYLVRDGGVKMFHVTNGVYTLIR